MISLGSTDIRKASLGSTELRQISLGTTNLWEGQPANTFMYEDYPGEGSTPRWNTSSGTTPLGGGGFPGYFRFSNTGQEGKIYSKSRGTTNDSRVTIVVDRPGTQDLDFHFGLKPNPLIGGDFNTYGYLAFSAGGWSTGLRDGNANGYYHLNLTNGRWSIKKGDIITKIHKIEITDVYTYMEALSTLKAS